MSHPQFINFTLDEQYCTLAQMQTAHCTISEPVTVSLRTLAAHHNVPQDFSLRSWVSLKNQSQSLKIGTAFETISLTHLREVTYNIRYEDQPVLEGTIDIVIEEGKLYTLNVQNLVNDVSSFLIRKL